MMICELMVFIWFYKSIKRKHTTMTQKVVSQSVQPFSPYSNIVGDHISSCRHSDPPHLMSHDIWIGYDRCCRVWLKWTIYIGARNLSTSLISVKSLKKNIHCKSNILIKLCMVTAVLLIEYQSFDDCCSTKVMYTLL